MTMRGRPDARRLMTTTNGRSIIIGLQESQSYQRFASRQQEVFPIFQVQICKGRGQKD